MLFLVLPYAVIAAGATAHVFLDHKDNRRTKGRVVELYLIWLVGVSGVSAVLTGYMHMGPNRAEIADLIGPGYVPSMFQWENAWADTAVGLALFISIWKRNGFLTASILIWAVLYWGDAIGHIMQLVVHDNRAPANVSSIPTDILIPLIAIALLIAYRKLMPKAHPEVVDQLVDGDAP